MREKILYAEKYRKGAMKVKKELLPQTLPFIYEKAKIEEIEMTEAGKIEVDGRQLEYVICRILTNPS